MALATNPNIKLLVTLALCCPGEPSDIYVSIIIEYRYYQSPYKIFDLKVKT